MYLCYLLLDLLKQSKPSRIVVVASDLHRLCTEVNLDDLMLEQKGEYSDWKAYNHSKLLNILFVVELSRRLIGKSDTFSKNFAIIHIWRKKISVKDEIEKILTSVGDFWRKLRLHYSRLHYAIFLHCRPQNSNVS